MFSLFFSLQAPMPQYSSSIFVTYASCTALINSWKYFLCLFYREEHPIKCFPGKRLHSLNHLKFTRNNYETMNFLDKCYKKCYSVVGLLTSIASSEYLVFCFNPIRTGLLKESIPKNISAHNWPKHA